MIALLLDWLTITAGPPWPWIVALPLTTEAPWARPRRPTMLSATDRAGVAGVDASRPLQPSIQDGKSCVLAPTHRQQTRQDSGAEQALTLRDLRTRQISGNRVQPIPAKPALLNGSIHPYESA